jgi:hypothetical protein
VSAAQGFAAVYERGPVGLSRLFDPPADQPAREREVEPATPPGGPRDGLTPREVDAAHAELADVPVAQLPHVTLGLLTHLCNELLAEYPADGRARRAVALLNAYDAIDRGLVEQLAVAR